MVERSILPLHGQRDFVEIQRDVALDGEQQPKYVTLIDIWPCHIQYVGGSETFRGRQLEGHITAVITGTWDHHEFGMWRPNMRARVIEGMMPDQILNIEYVNPWRFLHRSYAIDLMCRTLENE